MTLRRILSAVAAMAIAVTAFALPMSADGGTGAIGLQFGTTDDGRANDYEGFAINLDAFMEAVGDNAAEGTYQFDFTIIPIPGLGGAINPTIKFLTDGGEGSDPANVRFTTRNEITEISRYISIATVPGDPSDEEFDKSVGDIEGSYLAACAGIGKQLRICTQGGQQAAFIVVNFVALHKVGDEVTEVYNMSKDPYIQNLAKDSEIMVDDENAAIGFVTRSGSPIVTAVEVDLAQIPATALHDVEPWTINNEYVAPEYVAPEGGDNNDDESGETTTAAEGGETTTAAEGETTTTAAGDDAGSEGGVNPAVIVGCIVGAVVVIVIIVVVAKKKG